VKLTIDAFVIV